MLAVQGSQCHFWTKHLISLGRNSDHLPLSATNIVVETQLRWLCFALRWKQEDCGWARCRQWGTERGVVLQVVHLGNLQLMNTENSTQRNTAHRRTQHTHRTRQDTAQLMSPLMDGIIPRLTAPVHWLFTPLPPQKLPLLPQRQLKPCQVFTKATLLQLLHIWKCSIPLKIFLNPIRLRGSLSKVLADTLPLLQSCCHF